MAPLVPIFPASTLPERVNIVTKNFKEKHRKGPSIELEKCQLLEMLQYSCQPPQMGSAPVCTPIVRWFRRYACCFVLSASYSVHTINNHLVLLMACIVFQVCWRINGRNDGMGTY